MDSKYKTDKRSICKRMLYYSLFATLTLLTTSAVNLCDTYFVSMLGRSATAAVGVTFAVQFFIQSIGFTLGMGGGSLVARARGGNREEDCRRYASLSVILSLLIGGLIALVGLTSLDPLLRLLGTTASIYPYAKVYLRLLLLSAPFLCISLSISQLLRAAGNAVLSAIGFCGGSLLNLLLVPLLLFKFDMGIAGAGYALLIGYAASTLLLICFTFSKHSKIRLTPFIGKKFFRRCTAVFITGFPSFCRHAFSGLATLLINNTVRAYGDSAIAAITVVSKISLLSLSFCTGIGQGMIPVAGYHFGANEHKQVRTVFRFAWIFSSAIMLTLSIGVFMYAPQLISLFRKEEEIVRIGTTALRMQSTVFVLHGTITTVTMLLQAIGKSASSTALACARQGIFFLPLLFLFPNYYRFVQPAADVLTFLLTLYFLNHYKSKLSPNKKLG